MSHEDQVSIAMSEQLHTLRGLAHCYAGNEMAKYIHAWIDETQGVLIAARRSGADR
jgi:hypothetical protein